MSDTTDSPEEFAADVNLIERFVKSVYESWSAYSYDDGVHMKEDEVKVLAALARVVGGVIEGHSLTTESRDPSPRWKHNCEYCEFIATIATRDLYRCKHPHHDATLVTRGEGYEVKHGGSVHLGGLSIRVLE